MSQFRAAPAASKRPFSSTSSPSASPAPHLMKKAKHPAAASSSAGTTEKNGTHLDPSAAVAVAAANGGRTNGEEDAEMVLPDQDELLAPSPQASAGVAANLFRKKATLPQPSTSARKPLRIKIGQPKLPTNFEEDTWAILKDAITAIFLKQKLSCDVEKLYQAAGDLCLHKLGANLYERIKKECEKHIAEKISALVGQSPDLVVFLSLVQRTWQDFCDQMLIIRGIALLLDVKYVKNVANICSVWDMGLQLFRKHLSLSPEIDHKTVTGLLRLIESERLGEAIDRTLLSHLLKMFTSLGMYSESFEKPFLECTSEFYATEGVKYMQQSDIPDYLKHVESRLQEEHERCILYLEANTRKPLIATTEKQLLERHTSAIIEKGFTMLMDANRVNDLSRMYNLFQRVNAVELLKLALNSYIRARGQGIIMDEEKDKDLVPFLLDFKASLDKIWEESFAMNEAFSNTIKESFQHLINLRQNRPAELIAKFLDEKLRAGNKGTSEEELEGILDKVLVLFRFIQGKDVFEAFYKKARPRTRLERAGKRLRGREMAAEGGEEAEAAALEFTPTWIVAAVCSVIVLLSLVAERFLHYLGKKLKKKNQKPLFEALQKVKEELMLLGFISLLLTVFQGSIQRTCIPAGWTDYMLPCQRPEEKAGATEEHFSAAGVFVGIGRRLLSDGNIAVEHCHKKGKVPLLSLEAIHHLHIFIFVLAITHVIFSVTTMLLGGAKIHEWKQWEDIIQKNAQENEPKKVTHLNQFEFIKKRFKGIGKDSTIFTWLHSFGKQFYRSVSQSDYTTMRFGFIMTHCRGNPKFDFHRYMVRVLEADFKKVVGISWYLWIFVVIFLLLNVNGWHTYFWIAFLPLILLLAIGTKLEHVIAQLAHDVAAKHTAIEGDLVVKPSDEHFWFSRPRIVLYLIHFILFQNAFEIAFFFWILATYGFNSCIMGQVRFIVPRLVIGVLIQLLCSYSTLPLYAIVTQMGSCYKKEIFNDHVQQGVLGWAQKAKMKGVKTGAGALASKADSAGPSVKIEMATKAPAGNDDAVININ